MYSEKVDIIISFLGGFIPLFSISALSIDSKIGDNNHIYSKLRSFISSENRVFITNRPIIQK